MPSHTVEWLIKVKERIYSIFTAFIEMELLLKHARSRDAMNRLESLSKVILELANQHADSYILSMLKYVIETGEIEDKKRFERFLHQSLPPTLEKAAMTLAQQWQEEGFQKGIQKGIQQGKLEGLNEGRLQERHEVAKKLLKTLGNVELIHRVTGLSINKIDHLREE